ERVFATLVTTTKPLKPGDMLVLMDGTYTPSTTGLPRIDCGSPGTARKGEAARALTLRALNERKAHLDSDGSVPGLEMTACSWWIVQGLRATNADTTGST